ncbi:MAG: PhzF family phenazine biosynthesis protein [Cyanobacteria bacterium P01_E01_bin.35]
MVSYKFYTADVFTDHILGGGNQLAVFPDAKGLSSEMMQKIAKEFNLSETAFVLPPQNSNNTKKLRIFTPSTELPFAGHPTIGTAHVLAAIGEILIENQSTEIICEEGVGDVRVVIHSQDGKPVAANLTTAQLPEFIPNPPEASIIARILSLKTGDLPLGKWSPEAVSCGVSFLFVPVRDRAALGKISLNLELWQKHLQASQAPQLYVFCFDSELEGSDIRARMFAPAMGIAEDPATGAAASALAGYLGVRDQTESGLLQWRVEQGFEMGRPSILEVEAEKQAGQIVKVRVGGQSVMVSEGEIEIPDV